MVKRTETDNSTAEKHEMLERFPNFFAPRTMGVTRDDVSREIMLATLSNSTVEVENLIKRGADVNALDSAGITPLSEALSYSRLEKMKRLLIYFLNMEPMSTSEINWEKHVLRRR